MNNYFIINKAGKALSMFEANNAKLYFRKNDAYSFGTPDEAEKFLFYVQGYASQNPRIISLRISMYPDGNPFNK